MAITQCPACGRKISDRAAACPHCGAAKGTDGQHARRLSTRTKANLRVQQLIAASLFIVGALWMISIHLSGSPGPYPIASLIFTAAGGIWYLLTRVRMLLGSWNN